MKQYMLICDENTVKDLEACFKPGLFKLIEIQGMTVPEQNVNVLVTPVVPPVPPMAPVNCPVTDEVKY
jgi:hypothetical protein